MGGEYSTTNVGAYPEVLGNGRFIRLGGTLIVVSSIAFIRCQDDGSLMIRMVDNSSAGDGRRYGGEYGIDAFVTACMTMAQVDAFVHQLCGGAPVQRAAPASSSAPHRRGDRRGE